VPLVVPASPVSPRDEVATPTLSLAQRRPTWLIVLVALLAGTIGWMAARRTAPRGGRDGSLGLSAPLPARGRLAIDGRAIALPEPGKKIPVEPGRHSISITSPRKEATQTFDVVVGPGEHVVLLVGPGGGGGNRKVDRSGERDGDAGTDIE